MAVYAIANMIKEYLNQPYPLFKSKWRLVISISLFIVLFMLIFQPFGLTAYHGSDSIFIIGGYGFVTFFVLIVDLFFIQSLLIKRSGRKSWTVIKQIFWLIWIILSIGSVNYLYSAIIFSYWSLYGFFLFLVYTLSVGIIPIVVLTMLKQNMMLSQNVKSAKEYNARLNSKKNVSGNQIVCLVADNQKDKFEIDLSDLLYIESAGNYIEVSYTEGGQMKKTFLRCALKRAESQLKKYPSMVRCHRAFLINSDKITQVKGNSQGLRLVLSNAEMEIPVSRSLSKNIKDKISSSY